jgi:hypothetical protein
MKESWVVFRNDVCITFTAVSSRTLLCDHVHAKPGRNFIIRLENNLYEDE